MTTKNGILIIAALTIFLSLLLTAALSYFNHKEIQEAKDGCHQIGGKAVVKKIFWLSTIHFLVK